MNDRLFALRLFIRVARARSFSAAARELGLSQPSASRILAVLEHDIGVALLTRTTRAVTLTEAGVNYLARIEPILAALEEADHAARGTGELRGTLRVGLSSSFGVRELIPRLPHFLERHPALCVDLRMSDERQELVLEGVDIAFRFGTLTNSSATARRLASPPRLLVASPNYLARAGTPRTPADLAQHSVIIGPTAPGTDAWSFLDNKKRRVSVRVEGRLKISASEGAIAAAVAGLGILSTGLWSCRAELASGVLVQVLAHWPMGPVELHAVFPAGRSAKPAARALTDYLAETLQE
jgi:DNA-binding transcriptional LysR family regulator